MSTPVQIVGSTGRKAKVTSIGELVVSNYDYSESVHQELAAVDTAYNFFKPKSGQRFVITALLYSADQQVSNTAGATVIIYEASSASTTTVDKTIHQDDMVRNDRVSATGLRILITEGKFLNAKTDDDDIHMTISGYYVPA